MLDFDCDVIRKRRKFAMHALNDAHAVRRAVEKIRIAECNMLRPGFHLLPYVRYYDIGGNYAEGPVVNRHDGTVTAETITAAAGFRVSGHTIRFAVEHRGIMSQAGQSRPVRYRKAYAFERHQRFCGSRPVTGLECPRQAPQFILELSAQDCLDSERA